MVDSRVYPGLERKPGGPDNWVERAGSLPDYIERIAKHLHYEKGMTISQAIATAVNTVKRWTTGTNHDGSRLKPETVAKAVTALAQWEALKAKSKVSSFSASVTVEMPDLPHITAFADPKFKTAMPLTVLGDGRVNGHAARWGTCHRGFAEGCTQPPHTRNGYAEFHTGITAAVDDDGEVYYVPTGVLSYGTDHPADGIKGAAARAQYYANTNTAGADVVAGEDEFGIWVAGVVRPGMSEKLTAAVSRNQLSGDWVNVLQSDGDVSYGDLVALLAVNTPGFNVVRASLDEDETGSTETQDEVAAALLDGAECPPCERRAAVNLVEKIEAAMLVASFEKGAV